MDRDFVWRQPNITPQQDEQFRDEKTGTGGIAPDILITTPREMEIKLRRQQEEIYSKNAPARSAVKLQNKSKTPS